MQEKEVRDKLNLVIEKLLNPGGPENEKELEESGGGTIGYFARDFGIQEWDWPQGVGLYGLLKIMKIQHLLLPLLFLQPGKQPS